MLRQEARSPKKCHGVIEPHWNAATSSVIMPHKAMNAVSAHPNWRCMFEAVNIISNEMIDSLARARVAT